MKKLTCHRFSKCWLEKKWKIRIALFSDVRLGSGQNLPCLSTRSTKKWVDLYPKSQANIFNRTCVTLLSRRTTWHSASLTFSQPVWPFSEQADGWSGDLVFNLKGKKGKTAISPFLIKYKHLYLRLTFCFCVTKPLKGLGQGNPRLEFLLLLFFLSLSSSPFSMPFPPSFSGGGLQFFRAEGFWEFYLGENLR